MIIPERALLLLGATSGPGLIYMAMHGALTSAIAWCMLLAWSALICLLCAFDEIPEKTEGRAAANLAVLLLCGILAILIGWLNAHF